MKRIILLCALFALFTTAMEGRMEARNVTTTTTKKAKIQIAILLDTSGSMQGLIEQAKSRLWNIVNTLTTLKYKGETPDIEIALYEYGSYKQYDGDYIRRITPLTTDLDLISKELFALSTSGSEEYCGTVIHRALKELKWSGNDEDMKLVYIAGNETFTQGPISYKTAIAVALEKNIYVNTIHCGDEETGIQDYWRDAAERGKGKFFNIDADRTVKAIKTPFDPQLILCNEKLNDTYIGYGAEGEERKMNQVMQDKNAGVISIANYAERAVSKSRSAYQNTSWDLVDLIKKDTNVLSRMKKEELPRILQDKTLAEIKAFVSRKEKERAAIQKEINELAVKRQEYINQHADQDSESESDLGNAITQSILEFAERKGYRVERE